MNNKNNNKLEINNLDIKSKKIDLLKQELDVNLEQQITIKKRIALIDEIFKEMPNTNPRYALLLSQKETDLIELDELKFKEEQIKALLNE